VHICPHLCFDGQCEAAFRFYQRLLGGKITNMLTYGDSPMCERVAPQWRNRIVHASLTWDDHQLLGADVFQDDYKPPQGFFVTIGISETAKARQLFEALAEGGAILMPFQQTFWTGGFGVVVDRFGTPWEVNSEQASSPS
jgi:PhnB protein